MATAGEWSRSLSTLRERVPLARGRGGVVGVPSVCCLEGDLWS